MNARLDWRLPSPPDAARTLPYAEHRKPDTQNADPGGWLLCWIPADTPFGCATYSDPAIPWPFEPGEAVTILDFSKLGFRVDVFVPGPNACRGCPAFVPAPHGGHWACAERGECPRGAVVANEPSESERLWGARRDVLGPNANITQGPYWERIDWTEGRPSVRESAPTPSAALPMWQRGGGAPRFTCPECGHASHPEPPDMEAFTDGEGFHEQCQNTACRLTLWIDTVINAAGEVTLIAHRVVL
jgi:hypothetical protein